MKGKVTDLKLKDSIALLRQYLDTLMSFDETDYNEVLRISEQLDALIVEYYYSKVELYN